MTAKVKLEKKPTGLTFQDLVLKLSHFWVKQACVLQQPYDVEVGAGTMHPEHFFAYSDLRVIAWPMCSPAAALPMDDMARTPTGFTSTHSFKSF